MEYKVINFDIKGDERGSLIAIEQNKDIPFDIKRIYYVFDTKKDVPRGFHAHKSLRQILIAVSGSCRIKVDDGETQEIFELNKSNKGLYIGKNLWREMYDFSENCVLLVLASEHYCPNEYIRDYNEFLETIKNTSSINEL